MANVLLVKYGEISLRKGNRAFFEHRLLDAIRENLRGMKDIRVTREQGRFLVEDTAGNLDIDAVLPRIRHIFGLAGFCRAVKTRERDIAALCDTAKEFFANHHAQALCGIGSERAQNPLRSASDIKSFRVRTKRSAKNYPLTSMEISAAIGEAVLDANPDWTVDLHTPEVTLWVEIRNDVYFYFESENGEGGLPYGSSGKGVLLLSGGFDSPVAGYLAARRGVEIVAAYCHSPPFVSERARDKVEDLTRQLAKYACRVKLLVIPFTDIQLFLKEQVSEVKLTIFLKRAMLHVASLVTVREGALALITGDSIGQVASQTIHSLAAMESAAQFPVLRPLAAMDKQSIIDISVKIGTHDISIRPYEDCCTVFVAKHPENKPNRLAIEKIEARFATELARLVSDAVENAEIVEILS